ncbi:unnamed protein product [Calypogeia fissa]
MKPNHVDGFHKTSDSTLGHEKGGSSVCSNRQDTRAMVKPARNYKSVVKVLQSDLSNCLVKEYLYLTSAFTVDILTFRYGEVEGCSAYFLILSSPC